MKALVGAFNQEKALVGAFSVIVQPIVEPMDMEQHTALRLYTDASHDSAQVVPREHQPARGGGGAQAPPIGLLPRQELRVCQEGLLPLPQVSIWPASIELPNCDIHVSTSIYFIYTI